MSPDQHAETVLAWLTLGAVGVGTLLMILRWLFHRRGDIGATVAAVREDVRRGDGWNETTKILRTGSTPRAHENSSVQARATHQEADARGRDRAHVIPEHDDFLPRSREELFQLTQAIRHKDTGKTKQEAIERAFGVKKGGHEKWKRLSEMFDIATTQPSRYQDLDEQSRPAELSQAKTT